MFSPKGWEYIAKESQQGVNGQKRTGKPLKCLRNNACEICNTDFYKKYLKFNYSYSDGQQSCPIVSFKNEGYTQSGTFKMHQVDYLLALSAVSWDHNYCKIFTKQTECLSRLGVSEFQGSLRLKTASKHVSEHNQTFWISNSGPLCIQAVPSSSTIRSIEARSKQHSNRSNATVLEQNFSICFPPFQSGKSNSEKGASRKGRVNDNTYTNMANTTLVYTSVRDVNTVPTAVGTIARSTVRSSRKQIPFSSKQETNISGLKSYRKSLEMEGILSNAVKLISQSKRPGSIISYKSGWSKWTGWCVREKIEQFCAHLSKIVNYLSTLFDEDLQYRAENAHR